MQAQMIYAAKNVAAMIAGRLSKSEGLPYEVARVATGFRVAPVGPAPVTNFMVPAMNAEKSN
jgi:hypothetical protein